MQRVWLVLLVPLCAHDIGVAEEALPVYKDAHAPIDKRITDLLGRMTLDEKVAQLFAADVRHIFPSTAPFDVSRAEAHFKNGAGQTQGAIRGSDLDGRGSAQYSNFVQKFFIEHTRLGIPVLFSEECLHGELARGATIFPQCVGMSCSWDPDLAHQVYSAVAEEARSRGAGQVLSPMIDVCREPRWGRIEEGWGEDTYLTTRYAVAIVRGFQGSKEPGSEQIDSQHVAATVKHFAAYGASMSGLNKGEVNYSERDLREFFLPPFRAAVQEAQVRCVMPAYHAINAVPCSANPWLLQTLLRDEWGFSGLVVSDYNAVAELETLHHIAADKEEAARLAITSGIDVETPAGTCFPTLAEQVKRGLIPMATIDRAAGDMLRVKFQLGLFDHPYVDPETAAKSNHNDAHRELALRMAKESIVLLKNDDHLLPLDASKIKTLAVIGPNADRRLYGGYSELTDQGVTVLGGLKSQFGDRMDVQYAEGCKIHMGLPYWKVNKIVLNDTASDRKMIAQAVDVARAADAAVVVVGDDPALCSEGHDVDDLDLIGLQNELVKAVLATGKPTVVVLLNGRPMSCNFIATNAHAILEGWYPGEEGGNAIASVLFGTTNPTGKLTTTFPRSVGQLPLYYNKRSQGGRYVLDDNRPLYPFGFGLSYSTFKYANLAVSPAEIGTGGEAVASVDLTNTGDVPGSEIVEMYLHQEVSSIVRPPMELKGFERVALKPKETRRVSFDITPQSLQFLNAKMKAVVEPGKIDVMVGPSSTKFQTVHLLVK
jgi:beta-glucosidase